MINYEFDEENKSINEELIKYIDYIIGSIDCGCESNYINGYIIEMERARVLRSKEVIMNLLNTLPCQHIVYMYHKEVRGLTNVDVIDILDVEMLINYALIGVLNIIKNKNICCMRHYSDDVLLNRNSESLLIVERAKYYDNELDKLISCRQQHLNKISSTNDPTIDFFNYQKQIKL